MRQVVRLSVCALMAVVLVTFPALGQSPKVPAASGEPIKIGGSLPLTGIASEQGKLVKAGYDYWAEDINKRGGLLGRPVKLIMYDDESSPDKAVTYYERAITVDKVELLFGGYPGPTDVALMPLAEKYGKVFIGQGGHGKSFEQGYTYSFASPPLMSEWTVIAVAGVIDDLIPKAQRPKTAAICSMNNVIGVSTRPSVVQWLEKNGIKVVVDEIYNLPLTDATPLISKAKGRNADILFCFSFYDDGVMLTRAAKAMNYNPKMIFHLVASTIPAWMKEMGPDGNNVVANMWWNSNLPYPGNDAINAGAKAKLGLPAGPTFFGLGYCWMKTLELAVQGAGTLDQKTIRDYLRSHTFDLPYMKGVTFDKAGLPPAFNYMIQMTNGQVQLIWPKNVATTKLVYPRPPWSK